MIFKKEPAVIIGILAGVLAAVATGITQATTGGHLDWVTFLAFVIPAISGVLTRFGVYSPAGVEQAIKDVAALAPKS